MVETEVTVGAVESVSVVVVLSLLVLELSVEVVLLLEDLSVSSSSPPHEIMAKLKSEIRKMCKNLPIFSLD